MFTIIKIITNKNDRIMRFYLEFGKNSLVSIMFKHRFPNVKILSGLECTELNRAVSIRCLVVLWIGAIDGISIFAYDSE